MVVVVVVSLRCPSDAEFVALRLRLFGTGFESVCGKVRRGSTVGNSCWLAEAEVQRSRGERIRRVGVTYCSFTSSFASLGILKQTPMEGCALLFGRLVSDILESTFVRWKGGGLSVVRSSGCSGVEQQKAGLSHRLAGSFRGSDPISKSTLLQIIAIQQ